VDISLAQLCQGRFEVFNREAEMVQTLGVMAPRNVANRRRASLLRRSSDQLDPDSLMGDERERNAVRLKPSLHHEIELTRVPTDRSLEIGSRQAQPDVVWGKGQCHEIPSMYCRH
jgi:hypothetical protein